MIIEIAAVVAITVTGVVGAIALLKYTSPPRRHEGLIPPSVRALTSHGETEGWGIRPRIEEAMDDEETM